MKTLTEKQKNILEFIEEFLDKEGMAPTVYEIADQFDIKTSTVFAHLRALQRKKQLSRTSKARSISISGRKKTGIRLPRGLFAIPLLGRVNAGAPAKASNTKKKISTFPAFRPDVLPKTCLRCGFRAKACVISESMTAIWSSWLKPTPPPVTAILL